jgi:hypothetical protein
MPLAEQKKLLRKLDSVDFDHAVVVAWAVSNEPISMQHPYAAMLALAGQWRPLPQFPVTGDDLIALGMKPGKAMGDVLRKLEEQWEASDYTLSRNELIARLPR